MTTQESQACPVPTVAVSTGPPDACPASGPPGNELGPIAPSYDHLHRIDLIGAAREACPTEPGSYESTVRAVFQAAEVCLLNLARLTDRGRKAVKARDYASASRYIQWSMGFHRLLRGLGRVSQELQSLSGRTSRPGVRSVDIAETAGCQAYIDELRAFDDEVRCSLLVSDPLTVRATIATRSIDDDLYRLLHGIRICSHDATKWESDLSGVPLPLEGELNTLLATGLLADAVAATELHPGTMHGEFVALHQVPEILSAESNDHLELAVRDVRARTLSSAASHLALCNAVLGPMVEAQRVMAELLATGEYHGFRKNLGPASGTHSLAIKQHMFKDLFKHFWNEISAWLGAAGEGSLEDAALAIDAERHKDADSWLRHQLLHQAFRLHHTYQEWRHEHLHMPRNCLGSGGTKSMIGVSDGPQAVYKMRDAANAQPSLTALHRARGMKLTSVVDCSPLTVLLTDPTSVDSELMRVVGEATRDYFPEVQEQGYQQFHLGAPERMP
ncbi:hypothetical protein ACFVYR_17335 [Streptomyces sp. NPDC058284]|uniref:hypothetical protein n=1 Tax=unclassified Streptomyces TaxID=2593676 RepID=UPI0036635CB2